MPGRGSRALDLPIVGPSSLAGLGAPGSAILTRWAGSCCATRWGRLCWRARLGGSRTPLSLPSPPPAAGCPGQTGGGTNSGQPWLSRPCPQLQSPRVPPCCPPHSAHSHFPHPTLCPSLTQTRPSHRPSRPAAHIAEGAEIALAVDGWEDEAGGHCLPAGQHPQQQEAGALQQPRPQAGPAVREAVAPRLCLQRDLPASRDSPASPGTATPEVGSPGETGQLCCPSQDVTLPSASPLPPAGSSSPSSRARGSQCGSSSRWGVV